MTFKGPFLPKLFYDSMIKDELGKDPKTLGLGTSLGKKLSGIIYIWLVCRNASEDCALIM